MIKDLHGQKHCEEICDILVIGAGTVGLIVSTLIAKRTSLKVICTESGGYQQDEDCHALNKVENSLQVYEGATRGRFRCLGGTSTRWGGALIPFQGQDLKIAGWPINLEELTRFIPEIESLFKLEQGPYTDEFFDYNLADNFVNRLAKWPQFKKRNVFNLLSKDIHKLSNLTVWINSHVKSIEVLEDSSGVKCSAFSSSNDQLNIVSKKLIITAGAIETTRLALLIKQNNCNKSSYSNSTTGKYFADHISAKVAKINPINCKKLNRIFGFRFGTKGTMRNIRFELSENSEYRNDILPFFVHLSFEPEPDDAFVLLRAIFRDLQKRQLPNISVCIKLIPKFGWLFKALFWRHFYKKLLFPNNAKLFIHIVSEQHISPTNLITLSSHEKDAFGNPLANINWEVSQKDITNIIKAAKLFEDTWNKSELSKLGEWESIVDTDTVISEGNLEGVFHPTGSTKIGNTPETGTVDTNLKLFEFPNIQLLSTSVLPTGGGANPTMMLLLLGFRCIKQIEEEFNSSKSESTTTNK